MTEDEILELASDANSNSADVWVMTPQDLIDFAEAVAFKERKACAAICDAEMDEWESKDVNVALNNVAAEIRARGLLTLLGVMKLSTVAQSQKQEVNKMTKDKALKLALEALEWSYGGEPMPTKELEAMNAIRQALADQKGNKMTELRQAAEMALHAIDEGWLFEDIDKTVAPALRQALAEWTPDDTAYRPGGLSQDELPPVKSYCGGKPNYCEPEMPIDRGVWDDVPDATKWVDELRGDKPVADVNTSEERVPNPDKQRHECQELKASGPIGEIIEARGLIAASIPEMPPVGTKLYAAPYKLWITLSDDDIKEIVGDWGDTPIRGYTRYLFDKIDTKYRERNFG